LASRSWLRLARFGAAVFVVGVGAEDGVGLAVADVDVVNGEGVTVYGVDYGLEGGVVADRGGGQFAQLAGLLGSTLRS